MRTPERSTALKRALVLALLVSIGSLTLVKESRGHGGTYRGPTNTIDGAGGGGAPSGAFDVVPGVPAGPSTSGKGSSQPGATSGGNAQNGSGPSNAPPKQPTTGATDLSGTVDPLDWSQWWELNKDAYLDLKSHLYTHDIPPGSDVFFLGQWPVSMSRDSLRPTREQVRDNVVPALLDALESETHNEIITGALIALARTGRSGVVSGTPGSTVSGTLRTAFLPFLADGNQEIAETAALALGVLEDEGSVATLRDLLLDTQNGRELVGHGKVHYRTRAFAAYGLALIGQSTPNHEVRAHVVSTLYRALENDQTATKDVGVACVVALGRVPIRHALPSLSAGGRPGPRETWPASSCRVAQVDSMLAFFEDRSNDFVARAHAPVSIAALLGGLPESVRAPLKYRAAQSFIDRIEGKRSESREVVQGCVIALGLLGDSDADAIDSGIRKTLLRSSGDASDLLSRSLSCIALAQIAARTGEGPRPGVGRKRIEKELFDRLEGGTAERPWAAMALGVLGRADAVRHESSPEIGRALVAALERARVPHELSAYAVAAGMAGIEDALPVMHEKLEELSVDDDRGYVVLALGLLGRRDSATLVHGIVRESRYRPTLLRQAAVSLGMLGDKSAVPELLSMMAAARGLSTQAATASALGFIGDSRSIEPLLAVLDDEEAYTDAARGFAAVALGLISDDNPLPWNAVFSANLNYRASPPTLNDDRGAGLLNIL